MNTKPAPTTLSHQQYAYHLPFLRPEKTRLHAAKIAEIEQRTLRVQEIANSSALPPAPTPAVLTEMLTGLRQRNPVRSTCQRGMTSRAIEVALAEERALLVSQGCPTEARVRSCFAACGASSPLGAMLQWFCHSVIELLTNGASAVTSFPQEWETQLQSAREDSSANLFPHLYELQGFGILFSYIWSQWAVLESQLGTMLDTPEASESLSMSPIAPSDKASNRNLVFSLSSPMNTFIDSNTPPQRPPLPKRLSRQLEERGAVGRLKPSPRCTSELHPADDDLPSQGAAESTITATEDCRAPAEAQQPSSDSKIQLTRQSARSVHNLRREAEAAEKPPPSGDAGAVPTPTCTALSTSGPNGDGMLLVTGLGTSGRSFLSVSPKEGNRSRAGVPALRRIGSLSDPRVGATPTRELPSEGLVPREPGNVNQGIGTVSPLRLVHPGSDDDAKLDVRVAGNMGPSRTSLESIKQDYRTQKLKKQYGVPVIRNFGEERDVSDYVKYLNEARDSIFRD